LNSAGGGRKNWGYPQHTVDSPFLFLHMFKTWFLAPNLRGLILLPDTRCWIVVDF